MVATRYSVVQVLRGRYFMKDFELILASGSPRRRELISLLGLPFAIMVADVDEDVVTVADPAQNVVGRALLKAEAVRDILRSEGRIGLVLGSDTTVADGVEMLNKPTDETEAVGMLEQLRGRVHQVHTGIALCHTGGRTVTDVASVAVPMRDYSDDEIKQYVASGDPMDKAGAYAIQSKSFAPVPELRDCFAGVMGLPLCHLVRNLRAFGIELEGESISADCQTHLTYSCHVHKSILN